MQVVKNTEQIFEYKTITCKQLERFVDCGLSKNIVWLSGATVPNNKTKADWNQQN